MQIRSIKSSLLCNDGSSLVKEIKYYVKFLNINTRLDQMEVF